MVFVFGVFINTSCNNKPLFTQRTTSPLKFTSSLSATLCILFAIRIRRNRQNLGTLLFWPTVIYLLYGKLCNAKASAYPTPLNWWGAWLFWRKKSPMWMENKGKESMGGMEMLTLEDSMVASLCRVFQAQTLHIWNGFTRWVSWCHD